MTRDSASGTGPEPDSVNEVPETPGATSSTDATSPDAPEPDAPKPDAPKPVTPESKPVAVDTTDEDATDEGAISAPDLTLKPLPTTGAKTTSTEDASVTKDASVIEDAPVTTDAPATTDAPVTETSKPVPAPVASESTMTPKATSASEATETSSASEATSTPKGTSAPEVTQASSASETTPKVTSPSEVTAASSASETTPKVTPAPEVTTASSASEAPTTVPVVTESSSDPEVLVTGADPKPEKHSTLVPLVGTLVALAAVAALLVGAMALPIARSGPSDVPVGVAGTQEITGQLTTLMQQFGGEGTFEVQQFDSQNALAEAIEDREVYGGLFVDNTQATMMIASAAGIEVSDALQTVANALQSQAQAQVTVTDVVAQPTEDPRGDGLSAAELPLAIAAALPVFGLIALYRRRPLAQIGGAVLASAGLGLAVAAVLTYVAGSTSGGNFWLLSAGLAGGTFATTMILLGIYALAGRIGLGIGTAVLVLFGAPLSGLSSVPEWLPNPWGTLGQMLPPGATATVLRSMAFFDGAGSRSALLVMLMWTAVGLVLLGLGTLLHRSNERLAQLQAEEQAALRESAEDAAEDEKSPATV
jgi:hypothetical protein